MRAPVDILINPEKITVDGIDQQLYHVGRDEKVRLLLGLLRKYNPPNVLIFTNTKRMAEELARRLQENGFEAEYIIGDLPQKKRIKIIDSIKDGRLKFLVATDVASRGLHINDLDMVVNYDLPENPENYVHRIGRTARAGKTGHAIMFACERDVSLLSPIEMFINAKIPVVWAEDADYAIDKSTPPRRREGGYGRERYGDRRGGGRDGRDHGARDRGGRGGGRPRRYEENRSAGRRSESGRCPENMPRTPPHTGPQHAVPQASAHPPRPPVARTDNQNRPQNQQAQYRAGGPRQERRPQAPVAQRRTHPNDRPKGNAPSADRGHRHDRFQAGPSRGSQLHPPGRNSTIEERLAYYKQRYGDDFKLKESGEKSGKKGLLDGLKGLFKKKK
jgi:ATP-dependent RNA helicase RhlB